MIPHNPGIKRKVFMQNRTVNISLRVLAILVGDLLGSVSLNNFLVPAHILSGGLAGVAQLLHHWLGFPIGTTYFVMNVPLLIIGWRYLGRRFVWLTTIGIVGFSVLTDAVHINLVPVRDPLLLGLYGGVLGGLSTGLMIRVGGSSGGTDVLGLILNRLMNKSIGSVGFAINAIIVILSMTVFGVAAGMYTLIAMFTASRVINTLMHFQQRKTALIVTKFPDEIASLIHQRMYRGSTRLTGSGTYSRTPLGILMCALTRLEVADLKSLAFEVDEGAFITILDTWEIAGQFRHIPL